MISWKCKFIIPSNVMSLFSGWPIDKGGSRGEKLLPARRLGRALSLKSDLQTIKSFFLKESFVLSRA